MGFSLLRFLIRFLAPVTTFGLGMDAAPLSGAPPRPDVSTEKPHVLPQVDVNANVPLVKVGEFHLLEARVKPAAVAVGDFLYVIGGFNDGNKTLKTIERLNVRTGVAEKFSALMSGRFGHRAVLLGGKIYVLGGESEGLPTKSPFDNIPADNRKGSNGGMTIDQALAMGEAMTPIESDSSIEILDPVTGKVTRGPSMPDARSEFGCVAQGGEIFVFGGLQRGASALRNLSTVEILDTVSGKWAGGMTMSHAGRNVAALVSGGFIVVPGIASAQSWKDVAVYDPRKNLWAEIAPLRRSVTPGALAFLDHWLFIFEEPDFVAYDLVARSSETFTLGYRPVAGATAVVHEEKVYVIGGKYHGVDQNTVQIFALPPKKK